MTTPARPPSLATARTVRWWRHFEVPTLVLAMLLYAAWAALVHGHAHVPGVLLFAMGGCLGQLHSSLQHEAIHALRNIPKPLRWALVWPPLNLWLPYPLYHRSHSSHHVNFHLTHPERDTESVYHSAAAWNCYGPLRRAIVAANQTLAFRVTVGPWLRLFKMAWSEAGRLAAGDFSHAAIWLVHAASVAPIVWYVTRVCGMGLGEYLLYFVYPSMMLGALRSFTEHRWGDAPHERVAIVESNAMFGLLYLYNNLHHVHHRSPTMPWYEIPGHFRRNRAAVLEANGNFYYRGYVEIARRYLWRPVFRPVHPQW
ncbi:fatty acid desaturase [Variovorax saccharolyticus]|uniref:fatty acid desaturase n=1 Tax=Variovorax saccharolyticus TaxID=3053516 RepID=UPI002574ACF0|nr:fatty acid desaturase [Variovorax sp. J22R187]MDM0021006.1 fatty acid desaturase [Variovorax sp. J22R187]